MSLESTSTIKSKLALGLGPKAPRYWTLLKDFLRANISRTEFDEQVRECVDTPSLGTEYLFCCTMYSKRNLVQLHNALVVSIFDPSAQKVVNTPPPDITKGPSRKRKRVIPYQGPDPDEPTSLRSSRMTHWTVSVGKRERERIRSLTSATSISSPHVPRPAVDEIASERGVKLILERGGA